MKLKVRTIPIAVFYVTGNDAKEARLAACDLFEWPDINAPCFVTESFGYDGHVWETPECFETDYADTFGKDHEAWMPSCCESR